MRGASYSVHDPRRDSGVPPPDNDARDVVGEIAGLSDDVALTCYLCNADELEIIARHPDFGVPIRRCRHCDLVQTDPVAPDFLARYYKEAYAQDHGRGYSQSYASFCEARGQAQAAFIREHAPSRGFQSVLDYGAGPGGALSAFNDGQTRLVGVEPDPQMRAVLEQIAGVEIVTEESLLSGAYDGTFDLIILSHVLEHLSDPARQLLRLHRLLKQDGVLFVETPYEAEATSALTERFQMSAGHLFHFSERTLQAAIEADGAYEVEAVRRCGVSLAEFMRGDVGLSFVDSPAPDGLWIRALAAPASGPPASRPAHIDTQAALRAASAMHALSRDRNSLLKLARRAYSMLLGQTPEREGRLTAEAALPMAAPPTPALAELAHDAQVYLREREAKLRRGSRRIAMQQAELLERRTQLAELAKTHRMLKRRLNQKRAAFQAQSAANADLRERLGSRREVSEALAATNRDLRERLAKRRETSETLAATNRDLRERLTQKSAGIDAQTAAIRRLRRRLTGAKKALEAQNAAHNELRDLLAKRREKTEALAVTNRDLRERLSQRREAVDAQTAAIQGLRKRLTGTQKALQAQTAAQQEIERENQALRMEMAGQAEAAKATEALLKRDLQQSEAAIAAIRASRAHKLGVWLLSPLAAVRARVNTLRGSRVKR